MARNTTRAQESYALASIPVVTVFARDPQVARPQLTAVRLLLRIGSRGAVVIDAGVGSLGFVLGH
jgi:hypothetical protein